MHDRTLCWILVSLATGCAPTVSNSPATVLPSPRPAVVAPPTPTVVDAIVEADFRIAIERDILRDSHGQQSERPFLSQLPRRDDERFGPFRRAFDAAELILTGLAEAGQADLGRDLAQAVSAGRELLASDDADFHRLRDDLGNVEEQIWNLRALLEEREGEASSRVSLSCGSQRRAGADHCEDLAHDRIHDGHSSRDLEDTIAHGSGEESLRACVALREQIEGGDWEGAASAIEENLDDIASDSYICRLDQNLWGDLRRADTADEALRVLGEIIGALSPCHDELSAQVEEAERMLEEQEQPPRLLERAYAAWRLDALAGVAASLELLEADPGAGEPVREEDPEYQRPPLQDIIDRAQDRCGLDEELPAMRIIAQLPRDNDGNEPRLFFNASLADVTRGRAMVGCVSQIPGTCRETWRVDFTAEQVAEYERRWSEVAAREGCFVAEIDAFDRALTVTWEDQRETTFWPDDAAEMPTRNHGPCRALPRLVWWLVQLAPASP